MSVTIRSGSFENETIALSAPDVRAMTEYLVSPARRSARSTGTATWLKPAKARSPGK